jgi:hypothetical protein
MTVSSEFILGKKNQAIQQSGIIFTVDKNIPVRHAAEFILQGFKSTKCD